MTTEGMANQLQRACEAFERRAWHAAFEAFLAADAASSLDASALEQFATVSYLVGRDLEFQQLTERLYLVHVEAGDRERAARCCFWLGLTALFRGDVGQTNAWVGRGERLVSDSTCAESGYLLLPGAELALRSGHGETGHAMATEAAAIGERCQDADLTAIARHVQGRASIQQGAVPAGLKLLDDTMLFVIRGELSPIVTGLMYCSVIEACREVQELGRAREWTFALSDWCEQQSEMVAFTGPCLVHRAAILQLQGAWPAAMTVATRACERAKERRRQPPGAALYQQGEIYRLRGEYEQAEAAYREASQRGYEPQPGLALLRLGQGRVEAATMALRRLLSTTSDPVRRTQLLPAQVEALIAAGDLEDASGACQELQDLTVRVGTDVLRALSAHARGAIALAQGQEQAAMTPLRDAFTVWERLAAPYEAARVRVLMARACQGLGDHDGQVLELEAARRVFEALGARPDRDRLDAPAAEPTGPASRLTEREIQVLRLVAEGRTNRDIAGELGVSERTIDRHVSNILTKLDVPSRAAATAYAYTHEIL